MPKRQIRSHKGGRTERFPGVRIKPTTLVTIRDQCQRRGWSLGDWIEHCAGRMDDDTDIMQREHEMARFVVPLSPFVGVKNIEDD